MPKLELFLQVLGGLVVVGVLLVSVPAGIIVGGLMMVTGATLSEFLSVVDVDIDDDATTEPPPAPGGDG